MTSYGRRRAGRPAALGQDHDIAGLLAWDAGGPLPADSLNRALAHPRLGEASRALARNMLETAADGIFKDAGRYVAAAWAAHLHGSGELTMSRLKEASVSSGYLSRGRARDLLHYLLHLGFIQVIEPAGAWTPARYALTDDFTVIWRNHLAAALRAVCIMEPAAGLLLDRLGEPAAFAAFARFQSGGLLELSTKVTQQDAYTRVFLHRHAGFQVVWTLLAAGEDDFPSREPIPVSVAALARRFGVSRVHIKRMFDEAKVEGLVSWEAPGAIRLLEPLRTTIRWYYAAQMLALLIAVARTVKALPELATTDAPRSA